ncbi:EAL domain-containing protein [Cloacibacillus evryensis]|uniref:EAL domain-containing protein n=1 Tax=Cloacibacillus evryensis TaxID=508460 RepID=UPI00210CD651|nr:EAL domain-containing protein [Cloacibacillus evryensis]MCQ4764955.1 EAL domain-containing protein [Cloacibacillus evryensis]
MDVIKMLPTKKTSQEAYKYLTVSVAFFRSLAVILAVLLAVFFCAFPSDASQGVRKVRVGWFERNGYMEKAEDGSYYGYNYDYLRNISRYTGWRYEFVEGSFSSLYEALKRGEIDILGCVFYTKERVAEVGFPGTDAGVDYLSLFTAAKSRLAENDFSEFDGMRVGVDSDENRRRLLEFAKNNKFTVRPVNYRSLSEIQRGILRGDIDAGLTVGLGNNEKFRILSRFAPQPFYFAAAPGRNDLRAGLETALTQIKIQNPLYEKELSEKHIFRSSRYITFTREEQEYIKRAGKIKVAYDPNWLPYEFTDKDGKYRGITSDVFERISAVTGLDFVYCPADSPQAADADLISCFDHDYDEAEKHGLLMTDIYMRVPLMLVRRSDKVFDSTKDTVTVAPESLRASGKKLKKEGYLLRYCRTSGQCLEEVVKDNDVDQTLLSSFSAEILLDESRYRGLFGVVLQGYWFNACIALTDDGNAMLHDIINKAVLYISDQEVDNIVIRHVLENKEINLGTIIKKMPADVLMLALILLAVMVIALTFASITKSRSMKRIKDLLYNDQLTGALSQAGFERGLRKRAASDADSLYIIDFDVYKFQIYNETFGREEGDLLLLEIAAVYRRYFADGGLLARIYADHFAALALCGGIDELRERIVSMTDELKRSLKERSIIVNYGIYPIDDRKMPADMMMDYAAAAKLTVKGNSEKYIGVFDGRIYKKLRENSELISGFDAAAAHGEFIPYIQAKYDGESGRISGGEALVRWKCPDGRIIPPARFISLFEKSGQITRLDFIILEQVCLLLRSVIDAGLTALPISVNFSRPHLHDADFVAKIREAAAKYDISSRLIEIECTESVVAEDLNTIRQVFSELKKEGFSIALDDFGSGYSSLNTLISIPMDVIKLDRGFLLQRETDRASSEEVVETIISLAHKLSFKVVAEGVESRDQLDFLRRAGCDTIQGYYYARPVPPEEFVKML